MGSVGGCSRLRKEEPADDRVMGAIVYLAFYFVFCFVLLYIVYGMMSKTRDRVFYGIVYTTFRGGVVDAIYE